jgi:anti-anti-sigma factor
MPTRAFEARVRSEQPRVVILDLEGEINAFAEESLNAAYAEAEAKEPELILLNFSKVDYINSTGIALIVGLLARARKDHRRLIACGLSDHYIEIFNITRLVDYMHLYPDEVSALASKPA